MTKKPAGPVLHMLSKKEQDRTLCGAPVLENTHLVGTTRESTCTYCCNAWERDLKIRLGGHHG